MFLMNDNHRSLSTPLATDSLSREAYLGILGVPMLLLIPRINQPQRLEISRTKSKWRLGACLARLRLRQVLLAEMVARVVRRRMAADYHRTLTRGNKEYER